VLIREVTEAVDSPVMRWMLATWCTMADARGRARRHRLHSRRVGADVIERPTHPQVLALLEAQPEILTDCNRNGAIVGSAATRSGWSCRASGATVRCARKSYSAGWTRHLALDQAILSVLVAHRRRHGMRSPTTRLG
jgi:hypothetical protein